MMMKDAVWRHVICSQRDNEGKTTVTCRHCGKSAQWSATRAREHLAMCGNFKASDLESWKSVCTSIPPASLKKNATLRSIVIEATHGILTTIYSFHTCIQNVIRRALADRIPAEIVAAAKISTRESRILAFS